MHLRFEQPCTGLKRSKRPAERHTASKVSKLNRGEGRGLNGASQKTGACFLLKKQNKTKTCGRSSADVTNSVFCFQENEHIESKNESRNIIRPSKNYSSFWRIRRCAKNRCGNVKVCSQSKKQNITGESGRIKKKKKRFLLGSNFSPDFRTQSFRHTLKVARR